MKNITPESGSVSVDSVQLYSRKSAGEALRPQRSERTVRRYLDMLANFNEAFSEFQNPQTGGLNGEVKITAWHLSELQKVAELSTVYRNMATIKMMYKAGRA